MDLIDKVADARSRIAEAYEHTGKNHLYSAYSGGKDSQAVLSLVRSVVPNPIIIHNSHDGEKIDPDVGAVIVLPPKKTIVPIFLRSVDLRGQIDGTRRDEDKTVIFDGQEIHRSEMTCWFTNRGVFYLTCYFPIYDWTEEDVFRYLAEVAK